MQAVIVGADFAAGVQNQRRDGDHEIGGDVDTRQRRDERQLQFPRKMGRYMSGTMRRNPVRAVEDE